LLFDDFPIVEEEMMPSSPFSNMQEVKTAIKKKKRKI